MLHIKSLISSLFKLMADLFSIATSKEKLRAFLRIPLYANAIYLMVANITNALFGFFFWILVARLYSAENVGLASAIISAVGLLTVLSSLGFGYGIIKFLKASDHPVILINSSFTLIGLVSLTAATIYILGIHLWSPALVIITNNPLFLVIFIIFVPISMLSLLTDQSLIAERQARFVLIRNIVFNVLRFLLVFIFIELYPSFGIFCAWSCALFVTFLTGIFFFLPRSQSNYRVFPTINQKVISDVLHFSFRNYVSDLFWTTPIYVLPILVINLLGAENNAYFYIAWAICGILTMIPGTVSTALFAEGSYEELHLGRNIRRSLKMVFVILTPAVFLVWVLSDKVLLLFGNLYSKNATFLLRLLALASLPLAINVVYFGIKRVQRKMKEVMLFCITAGVGTIGISRLLLPIRGIDGIGIAWLVTQSIIAIVIIASWLKKQRGNLDAS